MVGKTTQAAGPRDSDTAAVQDSVGGDYKTQQRNPRLTWLWRPSGGVGCLFKTPNCRGVPEQGTYLPGAIIADMKTTSKTDTETHTHTDMAEMEPRQLDHLHNPPPHPTLPLPPPEVRHAGGRGRGSDERGSEAAHRHRPGAGPEPAAAAAGHGDVSPGQRE